MFGQTNTTTKNFEQVAELKALLFHNKVSLTVVLDTAVSLETDTGRRLHSGLISQNTLKSFTFVPTRTVTWTGDIVAYKIRVSLLSRSL